MYNEKIPRKNNMEANIMKSDLIWRPFLRSVKSLVANHMACYVPHHLK